MQDGFFNGQPTAIAQTKDGYIWIGTRNGLLRFDGVRFVPWSASDGKKLLSSSITTLLAASDGSLWIGSDLGLSHWVNRNLVDYSGSPGPVFSILERHDGTIWFSHTPLDNSSGAVCQVVNKETRCFGQADGNSGVIAQLVEDDAGTLWLGESTRVVQWKPDSSLNYDIKGMPPNSGVGTWSLVFAPDRSLLVGIQRTGPGMGLEQLRGNRWTPFRAGGLDGTTLFVTSLLFDHSHCLWVGTGGTGLYRICGETVDHVTSADGLSGDTVLAAYEDLEKNLWVVTSTGVDQFHEMSVATFSAPKGVAADEVNSVLVSHDDTVWVGRPRSLDAIRGGKVNSIQAGSGLPGDLVTSLLEDHLKQLWVGVDNRLFIYTDGKFRGVDRKNGSPVGLVVGLTEDVDGNVWAESKGPPRTLFRIKDFKVREEFPEPKMPAARKVAADPYGGIWLGLISGDLARYRQGKLDIYSYPHGALPSVWQLNVAPDGSVLGTTSAGLIAWRNGEQRTLTVRNGIPCDNLFAHITDNDGALWLYSQCGIIMIAQSEMQKWWNNPDSRLQTQMFDVLDGARPDLAPFNGAAKTTDGRLWFANGSVLQMIDPGRLGNKILPPVQVEEMIVDRKNYPTYQPVQLPPLARDLEIRYTALSFLAPQKVRFRYKLEGRDEEWQDAGTRRQAFYNDLKPGKYKFRVLACNSSGLWNEAGATLDFTIAPTWYQTNWFTFSCIAASLLLLWSLYRLRLYQLAKRFNTTLEARVAERTRIARDLHDTLLQSLHGLMFRFQAARNMLPSRPEQAMNALDGAITRTEQAIAESRDAIKDLRSEASAQKDLAEIITAMGKELADNSEPGQTVAAFAVTVEGERRTLSPLVQDDLIRIAREILNNAFRHAGARHIEAEIRYGSDMLRLRIRDDGKGIEPEILKQGSRPGHWGLPGIQERAQKIGAHLNFWSEAGAGTEVQLTVPSAIAYERPDNAARAGFFSKKEQL